MKLDDLKSAWQEEIGQSTPMEGLPMNAIINDVKKIHRAVRFRDFWMIFALAVGALLNVLFGWLTQEQVNWLSRLGVVVFIAATAVITVALLRARSVTGSDDWTLRSRIEIEIERLEKQRRLLDRVGSWFLLPMLIAITLGSLGGYHARTRELCARWTGVDVLCGLRRAVLVYLLACSRARRRRSGSPCWLGCGRFLPICQVHRERHVDPEI